MLFHGLAASRRLARGIVRGLDLIARGCIPVAMLGERIEGQYDLAVGLLIATAIVLAFSASGG